MLQRACASGDTTVGAPPGTARPIQPQQPSRQQAAAAAAAAARGTVQQRCCGTLCNMAVDGRLRKLIADAGVIRELVQLLSFETTATAAASAAGGGGSGAGGGSGSPAAVCLAAVAALQNLAAR